MRRIFVFCVAILISICNANAVMDLTGITNAGGWVQRTHTATYTVGSDGLSLFYRGQPTGMQLQNAGTIGGKIRVTDPNIPPRPRPPRPPQPQPNPGPNPGPNPTPGPAVTPRVNVLGAVAGMAGVVVGIRGLVDANDTNYDKQTWGGVIGSAVSGAAVGAGAAAVLNAIPGVGQVAWGAASAVVAVGAGIHAGGAMFSETDCLVDGVRTVRTQEGIRPIYACCNISKLSRIDAFRANIGDEMWDEFPNIRKCLQGGYDTDQGAAGLMLDDYWTGQQERMCDGAPRPVDMTNVVPIGVDAGTPEDNKDLCWTWTCEGNFVVDEAQAKCVPYVEPRPEQEVETPVMCFIDGDEDDIENWANIGDRLTCLAEKVAAGAEDAYMECLESGEWSQCKIICGADKHLVDGKCVPKTSDAQPNDKPDVIVIVPQKKCETPECKACKQLVEKGEAKWEDEVCVCKNGLDFVMSRDNKSAVCVSLDAAIGNIDKAAKNLDDIIGGLKLTVWKDAQGNFNTARLASDSIAGVVLGTTGALITSKLVKKKQVEDGFEDIQCVIGGQKVADWGDEFNVGMQ